MSRVIISFTGDTNIAKLDQISNAIGRLEGKVDGICDRLDGMNGSVRGNADKINELETFRDQTMGKATIIGAVSGFIGSIILMVGAWFFGNK